MPGKRVTVPAADERAGAKLDPYRAKRDFAQTPEPAGGGGPAPDGLPRFVVQRHRARSLHYDFRLEIDGVLVSWAVPKGVTLDPDARHLALHVEDHPIEYIDFEGVIPSGEYGGGDVIVWDAGTWELHGATDAREAVDRGEIHVDLHGHKLHGRVVLVRTARRQGAKEQWLVLHKRDDAAVEGWDPEDHPLSVLSGCTNDDVAANPERAWTREHGEVALTTRRYSFAGATGDELDALDRLGAQGRWEIGGRELALTNLDKVLFPARDESGDDARPITKRELIRYYASIAPVLLPHLADRPLNLHRYPDGVERKGFWQKQAPHHAPGWITRWHNDEAGRGESDTYLVADSAPALAWLANHAAVELHPWTSRVDDVHRPTYALVDIDPGPATTWDDVVTLARLHRTALEHLGTRGYPKTSGRRGIQVWVPIEPVMTFDETHAWVEHLSRAVARVVPDLVSDEWERRSRGGLARLDYTQNAINKTLVAPYSVRAAPAAPVSMPIGWDELDDPALRSDRWTLRTAPERLAGTGDRAAPMLHDPQRLTELV